MLLLPERMGWTALFFVLFGVLAVVDLDRLRNRTVTLLVPMGTLAACIYGAMLSAIRNRRATD